MSGYFRSPTLHGENVVFLCEDDLWSVPLEGGAARRLTSSVGAADTPCLSPCGTRLAFTARDEGAWEVYVMTAEGGEERRLTHQGAHAEIAAWTPDGTGIIYATAATRPFAKMRHLWRADPAGGPPEPLPYGVASRIAHGPNGAVVLGRHAGDPARWKRYRGGTAGRLWIDREGNGEFTRLNPAPGNLTAPMWIGERIYFLSDHEGIGNLYSCLPDGGGLRRHTSHGEFYARNARTDGRRIVYHAEAELYCHDPEANETRRIEITFHSPRVQRRRRFVEAKRYLQAYALSPNGKRIAAIVRGKLFSFANWEGAVIQHGERDGVRYRLPAWSHDGERIVCVADTGGEEALELHPAAAGAAPQRLEGLDIGRPTALAVSPTGNAAVVANHRQELLHVDLGRGAVERLDHSPYAPIKGIAWSPDGRWIAYGHASTERTMSIKIAEAATGVLHFATLPEFQDAWPAWDPGGRYLYFISRRFYSPVYDALHFELGFPRGTRPMLVTLRADLPNPFTPLPEEPATGGQETAGETAAPKQANDTGAGAGGNGGNGKKPEAPEAVAIDFEGITGRVLAFPVDEGRYGRIAAAEGKALYTQFPIESSLDIRLDAKEESGGALQCWNLKTFKEETLATGVTGFSLSRDRAMMAYISSKKLRVVKAGEKPPENNAAQAAKDNGRAAGWIDLGRIRPAVIPLAEWRQMYREAWRLQREHFWTEDMSGVDWTRVYHRYLPLLERVATRGEFSDLMWEMQGELGTSHAYEMGGDYRMPPPISQGALAADFLHDPESNAYKITHIASGDSWNEHEAPPLAAPGVQLAPGDLLLAINGQRLDRTLNPDAALVNFAGQEIALDVRGADGAERRVTVTALRGDRPARYRDWVNRNRAHVHAQTGGRAGYLHVPDMGPWGFSEFHRGWLRELQYPALIVDVRYNGGGHVSQLLLEKLARRRLGYDVTRWKRPVPYPFDALLGPMAALTNENAGSDGDMFSHAFKMLGLGPLIGMRTWGGVIGITRNEFLVDGGLTTQPEYAIWFEDVGWRIENYGTEPGVEVDITPQDYRDGRDPQLDRAIEILVESLDSEPPRLPEFDERPRLPLPELPDSD